MYNNYLLCFHQKLQMMSPWKWTTSWETQRKTWGRRREESRPTAPTRRYGARVGRGVCLTPPSRPGEPHGGETDRRARRSRFTRGREAGARRGHQGAAPHRLPSLCWHAGGMRRACVAAGPSPPWSPPSRWRCVRVDRADKVYGPPSGMVIFL